MKIWIDFINTPQVSFFIPFIKEFKRKNHEVHLTCRDSGNTVALLEKNQLEFEVIGNRVGKGISEKLVLFPQRTLSLLRWAAKVEPDIAIGQSSFYMPIVARILGIPSLYTNDNEYAKGNVFGFLLASKVLLPKALKNKNFVDTWPLKGKVEFYDGIKEGVYLSQEPQHNDSFLIPNQKVIYFRPEPNSAQYYHGPKYIFDDTLKSLSIEYPVVVLPRDLEQARHFQQLGVDRIQILSKPIELQQIMANCLLFIGAGGSMNREMAILGAKVLSIYQSDLLAVDKYLIASGRIILSPNITVEAIRKIIRDESRPSRDLALLREGERSYKMILDQINQLKYA